MKSTRCKNEVLKILVVGASGFLSTYLIDALLKDPQFLVIGLSRRKCTIRNHNLLIVNSYDNFEDVVSHIFPDIIINCAAITSHLKCEENHDLAAKINSNLPTLLSKWCLLNNRKYVHFSSDAVFSACNCPPYVESSKPKAEGSYARTKLAAEHHINSSNSNSLILRTNFFGWHPEERSILDFFYTKLINNSICDGYDDYIVTSIYIEDLVDIVIRLIKVNANGIFHIGSKSGLSKYEFGMTLSRLMGLTGSNIKRTFLSNILDSKIKAKNISLSSEHLEQFLGIQVPTTAAGITKALERRVYWKGLFV